MPIMRQFDINKQDYSEGPSSLSMTRAKLVSGRPQQQNTQMSNMQMVNYDVNQGR